MKLINNAFALMLVASASALAGAQTTSTTTHKHAHAHGAPMVAANPQALSALQKDLETAIQSMTSALPIYDGDRVKSIHASHRTLLIVDNAIAGANAVKRTQPKVTDHVSSKSAKGKYTAAQIQASQTAMQQGLAALQQASKDLQAAAGSNPNKAAIAANKHLQLAITEANKAINIHSSSSGVGTTTSGSAPGSNP